MMAVWPVAVSRRRRRERIWTRRMVDNSEFQRLEALSNSGKIEEAILEARALMPKAETADERAALVGGILTDFAKLGRLREARLALAQLKRIPGTSPHMQRITEFHEAVQMLQEDRFQRGAAALGRILERHPEISRDEEYRWLYEEIQERRASALVRLKRYSEALPILVEAASSFSFDHSHVEQRVRSNLAEALKASGRTAGARQEFERTVELGPRELLAMGALWELAILDYERGAAAQAKEKLERILRDFPVPAGHLRRQYVYEFLAGIFHYAGDSDNEEYYSGLARQS